MTRDEKVAGLRQIVGALEPYAAHCLCIADKEGKRLPFTFNAAQIEIHRKLELQLKETGKVRAIVLKARQMGISTYIAGRLYHKVTTNRGKRAMIVGHEQKSTDSLYGMVKYFSKHNPLGLSLGATNAKELIFDRMDSGYRTATAGTEDVGRGSTSQYAHLSEFAFWKEGQKQLAGLGNTVAELPGTEIIIESTANGLGNAFHTLWQDAEAGINDWLPVFLPWFAMPEYRAPLRANFSMSPEDVEYMRAYGLEEMQMQWRANKIATYGDGWGHLWNQEYPACSQEAFALPASNPLINPAEVNEAVRSKHRDRTGVLIVGCDPAGDGANDADRTAIVWRRARTVEKIEWISQKNTMQIAGRLAEINRDDQPDGMFVDKGGLGAGIYDRLTELNVPVIGVNNASRANDSERYENKRAECWYLMKEWLHDHPNRIPNDAALISDICAPQPRTSSNGRKMVEKKDDMKKRGIRSPDGGDALALTFAEPVQPRDAAFGRSSSYHSPTKAGY